MKVSNKILKMLKADPALRMGVALALGISEQGVIIAIKRNSSSLTKIAAVKKITEITGLTENEILAPVKATA